jgi:putative transposase
MDFITLRNSFIREQQVDYYALPTKVSQMCLKKLIDNFNSFYIASKDFKIHPEKYNGKPKLPNYLDKDCHFSAEYYTEAVSQKEFKKGFVRLSKTNIKVPFENIKWKDFVGARITPKTNYFVIEVLYEVQENVMLEDNGRYLAIDLGLNNLAAITNNFGEKAVIINGRPIKSINQFFNKEKARLQSELKISQDRYTSKKLYKLSEKRSNRINDYMHKATTYLVNLAVSMSANTIVIGRNKEWKQDINLGKVNNQNFVSVPFL